MKTLSLVYALGSLCYWAAEGQSTKPNILYLVVDDLRPEIGILNVCIP